MPCPRVYCGGTMMDHGGQVHCVLCARGEIAARPPTARQLANDKKAEKQLRNTIALRAQAFTDSLG